MAPIKCVCVCGCDCDGKNRSYDDNVDVIRNWAGTDKNVTGCCAFRAWSRLEIWRKCERIWNVQLIIYCVCKYELL